MPPTFNLQSVLDVRHSRVEALEIELGKMIALQQEAQKIYEMLLAQQAELFERLEVAQSGELDLFQISVLHANVLQIDEQVKRVAEELAKINALVDAKRGEMVEAKQEEETLQILKRKRIEVFNAEQAIKEARTQDDIYIAQAFRARKENS
jgi:flagellar export protein FliJ